MVPNIGSDPGVVRAKEGADIARHARRPKIVHYHLNHRFVFINRHLGLLLSATSSEAHERQASLACVYMLTECVWYRMPLIHLILFFGLDAGEVRIGLGSCVLASADRHCGPKGIEVSSMIWTWQRILPHLAREGLAR